MRRKTHNSEIQQMAFSFEETSPVVLQESNGPIDTVSLIEQKERDQAKESISQQEQADLLEYNREKAIARFLQIGDELGINDNYWKTSWRNESDERIQPSLVIWEQYSEDVRSGRKIHPKIGGQGGKHS